MIVANGNLWHRSGSYEADNVSGAFRVAILALYCRSFLRPQEDYSDIARALASDDERASRRIASAVPYPFGHAGPDERFAEAQALATSAFL